MSVFGGYLTQARKVLKWIVNHSILAILILGWLILTPYPFLCALERIQCDPESARWWGLFISALGVPAVVYHLYRLRETIQKGMWRPEIEIGLVPHNIQISDVDLEELSSYLHIPHLPSPDRYFVLIVVNTGEVAANYVKIHLELLREGTEVKDFPLLMKHSPNTPTGNGFVSQGNGVDYVYRGEANWRVYPNDFEQFRFHFRAKETGVKQLRFRCEVWADGLDKTAEQILTIAVDESQ